MTTDELRSRLEDINDKLHLSVYEDTGNPSDVAITDDRGEDWLLYLFKERQYVPKGVEVLNEDKQHSNFAKLLDLINEYWDTADGFQKILKRKNSSTTVPHVTLSKENQKIPNDLWQRTKSDDLMWDLKMKVYKEIDNWLTKSTFDYADKKLREDLEPFLDWLNSSHIKYSLRWYEPKPWDQVGPQFNIYLLNDEEKPAAILESYWDGKEVVGAMVHGSDVFDRQRLDAVKDRLMLYLPTYHYRFDERIFQQW